MTALSIFVSHSHHDNAFCQALVKALRVAGADVWYDEHDMGAGQLGPTIERELRTRPVFIVILSPSALVSQWVEDETRWAYNLYRRDPTRIMLPVIARPLPDMNILWLFLEDFRRIEAGKGQPYEQDDAVHHALRVLALTPVGEQPTPLTPQPTENAGDLIVRGKSLRAQSKFADALVLLQRATIAASTSSSAWFQFGYTLNAMKQYEEALVAYNHAIALNHKYLAAWNNKGGVLVEMTRYEEALLACERALVLDPDYAYAWSTKGLAHSKLMQYDRALISFERAIALDSNQAISIKGKTLILDILKLKEQILLKNEEILKLDPHNVAAWIGKADSLSYLGYWDESLAASERALIFDPSSVLALTGKANVLRLLGRYHEAWLVETKAKELEPHQLG